MVGFLREIVGIALPVRFRFVSEMLPVLWDWNRRASEAQSEHARNEVDCPAEFSLANAAGFQFFH
jgi:hypothetical protein